MKYVIRNNFGKKKFQIHHFTLTKIVCKTTNLQRLVLKIKSSKNMVLYLNFYYLKICVLSKK